MLHLSSKNMTGNAVAMKMMKNIKIICVFCLLLILCVSCSKENEHKSAGNQEHKTSTKIDAKTEESDVRKHAHEVKSSRGIFSILVHPTEKEAVIGEYHSWLIQIKDSQGRSIENARILISGGMDAHGHGLPNAPKVTKYLGKGKYLIEGMRFNMAGEWNLQFAIQSSLGADRARIDFTLDF